uniref:Uncharacterized protein n=1 Tax=Lepeophtheirus salmonis TaxID=72036 RepID=A0A0K2TVW6_LEPSM
MKGTYSDLYV